MNYYLARNWESKEAQYVICKTNPINHTEQLWFVVDNDCYIEEIDKAEFDTYVAFGFKEY